MTRQVSLSEEAYAALRREKGETESFSQAVLRLLKAAKPRKDPMAWVRRKRHFLMSREEHLKWVEEMRDADRVA